jgi:hypothetical protein
MMRKSVIWFFILLICILQTSVIYAQTAQGGGVYIRNNGKMINCIVTNNYAVTGFGVAGTAGEVINSTIKDNFYLKTSIVNPGDLFFNDGVVYTPQYDTNGNLVFPAGYSSSDVMGICFWSNTNNNYMDGRSWIVAVDESVSIWCPNGMTGSNGYNPIDIPELFNFSNAEAALMDYEGRANTSLIVNEPGFVENPTMSYALTIANCAAKYSYEYRKIPGEDAKWFLPSLGQLRVLENELTLVNQLLGKLGKSIVTGSYWSSNEYSRQLAWSYFFPHTSQQPANSSKSASLKIRPVSIVTHN